MQVSIYSKRNGSRISGYQRYIFINLLVLLSISLIIFIKAAVERVPEIKPEQVEEVFFGNVLSAKYELLIPR